MYSFVISVFNETRCIPEGSETLPKGIVTRTSDLEMQPLWGPQSEEKSKMPMSLLAIAAGIKQKETVNKIIEKFPASDFVLMLFHYDGVMDEWKNFEWNDRAIHVSAINQTKWWFAKRFLHPDIVSAYSYIILWDEDLGVANFNAKRYLSIVRKEGLQISQPALDPDVPDVHHPNTARKKEYTVHRRNVIRGSRFCHAKNTKPPCAGFVEIMAPDFSGASWRCVWHMIQNDLVFGWGLDFHLGYHAQGFPVQNIGIADAEYISHEGIHTLVDSEADQVLNLEKRNSQDSLFERRHGSYWTSEVKKHSIMEGKAFKERWKKVAKEDKCWLDIYEDEAASINKHI